MNNKTKTNSQSVGEINELTLNKKIGKKIKEWKEGSKKGTPDKRKAVHL